MSRPHILYRETEAGWVKWAGGKCPVKPDTTVRLWLKGIGETRHIYLASQFDWGKRLGDDGERMPGSVLGYKIEEAA